MEDHDIVMKAKALMLLKDALGAAFAEQKSILLDSLVGLGDPQLAAVVLVKLLELKFVDHMELVSISAKLVSAPAQLAVAPATRAPAVQQQAQRSPLGRMEVDTTTALALLVDSQDERARIDSIRSRYDSAFGRWMPHVNFLFPFVPSIHFDAVRSQLQDALGTFGDFDVTFDKIGYFSQKDRATFHLAVSRSSLEKLQSLNDVVHQVLPLVESKHAQFVPHLTLGQCEKGKIVSMQEELNAWLGDKGLVVHATHLSLIARSKLDKNVPFSVSSKVFFDASSSVAAAALQAYQRVPLQGDDDGDDLNNNNNNVQILDEPSTGSLSAFVHTRPQFDAIAKRLMSDFQCSTLGAVVDVALKNKAWNLLEDYSTEERRLFDELLHVVLDASSQCFNKFEAAATKAAAVAAASSLSTAGVSGDVLMENQFVMLQFWDESNAQLLVLPVGASPASAKGATPCFAIIEPLQGQQATSLPEEDNVLVLLDVSSSMNHDEKGSYQAPDSPDHPASSIKKARSVCVEIAIISFKGGCSAVSVVPWHNAIGHMVKLKRSDYVTVLDGGEREELLSDDAMRAKLTVSLGEKAFKAGGATNVESALNFAQSGIVASAKKAPGKVSVWFITDGEPTMANYKNGGSEADYIPMSKQHPQYEFFNTRADDGLTQYEKKLCETLQQSCSQIRELGTDASYHFCVFGEALPQFMLALATASGGLCHPVRKDLETIISEFKSSALSSQMSCTLQSSTHSLELKASPVEGGVIYARGAVPSDMYSELITSLRADLRVGSKRDAPVSALKSVEKLVLDQETCTHIAGLLDLEYQISALLEKCRAHVGVEASLADASQSLGQIKRRRVELLGKLARKLRFPLLKAYLESFMDTLMVNEAALERLVAQFFLNSESRDVSKVAAKMDMLTKKDLDALAAGAKSLQSGLGGFVAKRYDRQVAKIISTKGNWARKMLQRVCQLHKTETNPKDLKQSETLISLFIFENNAVISENRRAYLEGLGKKAAAWGALHWTERVFHDPLTNELCCTVAVWEDSLKTKVIYTGERVLYNTVYPRGVVDQCFVRARSVDVSNAEKEFLDPLSYANFLELIEEQQTLPACVYNIAESQGASVLFDAKELLRIVPGDRDGAELTSFSYFRMLSRVATQQGQQVNLAGAFHQGNFALPFICDEISCRVFANLLPGLLSEPITGSSLAPLTETGLFYIAFLYHHMRVPNPTSLDVQRMSQWLGSLAQWIDNPKTNPSLQEVTEATARMFQSATEEIQKVDSPGFVPLRAIAYGLLDSKYSVEEKHLKLYKECATRALRGFFSAAGAGADEALAGKVVSDKSQVFRALCEEMSGEKIGEFIPKESSVNELENDNNSVPQAAKRPLKFLEASDVLAKATKSESDFAVLMEIHGKVVVKTLCSIFVEKLQYWEENQRVMFCWSVLAFCMPLAELKARFSRFAPVDDLVDRAHHALAKKQERLKGVLWAYLLPDGTYRLLKCDAQGEIFEFGLDGSNQAAAAAAPSPAGWSSLSERGRKALYECFCILTSLWSWSGSAAANAHGLSPIDWEVVAALTGDASAVNSLNAKQLQTFQKAKEFRDTHKVYFGFLPPPPKIKTLEGELIKPTLGPREIGTRPRSAVSIIGDVDHGKSTLVGHLLFEAGEISGKVMRALEKQAFDLGKPTMKYAWLMDTLRAERERGVTIEWSLWSLTSPTKHYEVDIVDTPGHASFVKNMSVGASLCDAVVVVLSAVKGEFESAWGTGKNTQQEILLCISQGVRSFIFAINKMDTIPAAQAQERFEEIKTEVLRAVAKKFNMATFSFVPVSAWTGMNLIQRDGEQCSWWQGSEIVNSAKEIKTCTSLFEAMDHMGSPVRDLASPFRMPIVSTFKIKGVGTVVSGRILSGILRPGDDITLVPGGESCKVKSIEMFHQNRPQAQAGDIVGLALSVRHDQVARGMVVVPQGDSLKGVTCFVAQVKLLREAKMTVRPGYHPTIFLCTSNFCARFEKLLSKHDAKGALVESDPKEATGGDTIMVRMTTNAPVAVDTFAACPPLGRFCIRDNSKTVAVGVIKSIEAATTAKSAPGAASSKKGKYFK